MSMEHHPGLTPPNESPKPRKPAPRPQFRVFGLTLLLLLVAAGPVAYFIFVGSAGLSPLGALGPVLQITAGDDTRVYMLTSQWRTHTLTTGRYVTRSTTTTDHYVDLWAFSARDAKPIWRKRLQSERGGAMYSRQILGAVANTIWLLMQGKLIGIAADTGDVVAAAGAIETRNPELKGKLPAEERYYRFEAAGLIIKAADGRDWRIDGTTLLATPLAADMAASANPATWAPAY